MYTDKTTQAWQEYQEGKDYNRKIKPDLYKTVDRNEAFYSGDQWQGVQANGLPTPVFNIFKRVIDYFIASIMSERIKVEYKIENIPTETEDPSQQNLHKITEKLSQYANTKWEKLKMDSMLRDGLLDAAISGDMVAYTYWDASIKTGQDAKGDYVTKFIDNVNVMFGNPNERNKEEQPYILIAGRDLVSNLRKEAKFNGISAIEIESIVSDVDTEEQSGDRGKIELDSKGDSSGKCTYLIKLMRDDTTGTILFTKSTKTVDIRKQVNTKLKYYPIAIMNWTRRKNSYHGQALGTGLIPNQIIINKIHAMFSKWCMDSAYGKVLYDKTRIASWSSAIGTSIGVNGDTSGAVYQVQPGQMNGFVVELFNLTMQKTLEMIGVNDVLLGNVKPDNAAAIISIQKQSGIPLETTKQNLYQFIEDIALTWMDFNVNYYNVPRNLPTQKDGKTELFQFSGQEYIDAMFTAKVEVGASTYWSEISELQTLDALLKGQYIDFTDYLERLPNGLISKKKELMEKIAQRNAMIQQQQGTDQQTLYEQMMAFMETLPQEVQAQLKSMPDGQMEEMTLQLMKNSSTGQNFQNFGTSGNNN